MDPVEKLIALGVDDIDDQGEIIHFSVENCPMEIEKDEITDDMTLLQLETKSIWYSYCCDMVLNHDNPVCPAKGCNEYAR